MGRPSRRVALALTAICVALLAVFVVLWLRGDTSAVVGPTVEQSVSGESTALHGAATVPGGEREVRETAPEETPAAATTALLSGGPRVVVALTDVDGEPVADALVAITADGPLGVHSADADGLCVLPVEPGPELIELRVSAPGFVPACVHYGRVERIEIQMFQAADVKGRVVRAADRSPVPGARVALAPYFNTCSDQDLTVDADGSGRFELAGVALGRELEWRVDAEGFASLQRKVALREPPYGVELALARGVALEFLVVDAESETPIEGATISRDPLTVTADGLGRAMSSAFLSIDEEDARVRVRAPGYCTLSALLRRSEVAAGAVVRFPLLRGLRLEGSISDPDGAAVANARVWVRVDNDARWKAGADKPGPVNDQIDLPLDWTLGGEFLDDPAVSDSAGRFALEGLEPLSRWYRLLAEDATGRRRQPGEWQPLPVLGPPGSTEHIQIVLPRAGTAAISGAVTLNGKPATGSLRWQGPTQGGGARAGADGHFRMQGVESGHIAVYVRLDEQLPFDECKALFDRGWSVEVAEGAEARLDLPLDLELSSIAGRVVDGQGQPCPGVEVTARSLGACWRSSAITDAAGGFEIVVRAGPWPYTIYYGRHPENSQVDEVVEGTRDLELVLSGIGKLRLRVVDRTTRQPLTGFLLEAQDEQGQVRLFHERIYNDLVPDPEGWHEALLRQGSWRLHIGDPVFDVSGYLPLDGGSILVRSEAPVGLELERERGLELGVRLEAGQQAFPNGVTVLLLETNRVGEVASTSDGWKFGASYRGLNVVESRQILPDPKGLARAVALWPGPHRFVAFPDTIAIEPAEVVVTGSETEPVEIRWKPR